MAEKKWEEVFKTTIKCPKCGSDVPVATISGICGKCKLLVLPNGETMPAPYAMHHNEQCDMVRGPCLCGAWHEEEDQIERAKKQRTRG